jgi:hypothetical protein
MAKLVVGDATELFPPDERRPTWELFVEGHLEEVGDPSIGVKELIGRVIGVWTHRRVFVPIPMAELIASVRDIYQEWEVKRG